MRLNLPGLQYAAIHCANEARHPGGPPTKMAPTSPDNTTNLTTCSVPSSTVSDCQSAVVAGCGTRSDATSFLQALVPIHTDSREHVLLNRRLHAGLRGTLRGRNNCSCMLASACRVAYPAQRQAARARFEAFRMLAEDAATEGHAAGVRLAWYGARSEEEAARIAREGFGAVLADMMEGVCLWPENRVANSIASSGVDSRGLRHILLCQLILVGSNSDRNDDVVAGDQNHGNDADPTAKKTKSCFVVRPADATTCILPLYAVAVKMLRNNATPTRKPHSPTAAATLVRKPSSPWIPLAALVTVLSRILPENRVCLIKKLHNAYVERKISRQQMISRVRQLSGDKILVAAIRAFQAKMKMVMKRSATKSGSP